MRAGRAAGLMVAAAAALALGLGVVLTAPDTAVPWSFLGGGGGGTASSTNYALGTTLGQPAAGPAGSTSYSLGAGYRYGTVDSDGEGLLDLLDPCPLLADCDGDSWTDWQELAYITTDAENTCTPGGYVPDPLPAPDGNGTVAIDDVFFAASRFNQATGDVNYTPRAEIASQDGVIGIDDIFGFASRFGQTC